MRCYWKALYLLPLSVAATLSTTSFSHGQEGVPAAAEVEAAVDDNPNEAAVEAELDGEAPEVEGEAEAPAVEVKQPTVEAETPAEVTTDQPTVQVPVPDVDVDIPGEAEADRPRADRNNRRAADVDARFTRDLGLQYEAAPQAGFRVSGMADDGLWARAGFRQGDRVVRVGDQRLTSWNDFRGVMGDYYGKRVPIYVIRDDRQFPVYLDLTDYERPTYLDPDYDLDRAQRAGFGIGLNKVDNAVVVSRVYPSSPAALAGMRVGDIIISANTREIENVDDVVGYIRSLTPGDDLVLQVRRAGENLRVSSRLATWAEALDTAPPEEIIEAQRPGDVRHYANDHIRLDALEERIRDLEEAVRGLRRDLTQGEPDTRTRLTEPQQRDLQSDDLRREDVVPAPPRR
jgi:hypothetical protein